MEEKTDCPAKNTRKARKDKKGSEEDGDNAGIIGTSTPKRPESSRKKQLSGTPRSSRIPVSVVSSCKDHKRFFNPKYTRFTQCKKVTSSKANNICVQK